MKLSNIIKAGACLICILFVGNTIALDRYLTLAADEPAAVSKPDMKESKPALSDKELAKEKKAEKKAEKAKKKAEKKEKKAEKKEHKKEHKEDSDKK